MSFPVASSEDCYLMMLPGLCSQGWPCPSLPTPSHPFISVDFEPMGVPSAQASINLPLAAQPTFHSVPFPFSFLR